MIAGRNAFLFVALAAAGLLAACGQSEKFNRAAFEVCLADAKKPGSRLASATFEAFEKATIGSSTGDDYFRVSIPYVLNGQPGHLQCLAEKLRDGTFKAMDSDDSRVISR
jgi:hypothetical protein